MNKADLIAQTYNIVRELKNMQMIRQKSDYF